MKSLQEKKNAALQAYKLAKSEYTSTVNKENLKGDFEKWKIFCDAKAECMRLGVIL